MAVSQNLGKRSGRTLKRSDIAAKVHKETGLPLKDSADLVGQVFSQISDALSRDEKVKLAGFGTFSVRQKAARLGRNPKTGKECLIDSRKVLTFKPSEFMKERVEQGLKLPAEPKIDVPAKRPKRRMHPMSRQEWISLFELLGIFLYLQPNAKVNIDGHKLDVTINTLNELKSIIEPTAPISKRTISSWFTINRGRLQSLIKTDSVTVRFETLLTRLETIGQKPDIIFSMLKIAVADGDYDEAARALIVQAILHWDMSAKVLNDIEDTYPDIASEIRNYLVN